MDRYGTRSARGFTLVELLIVIGIIILLISILVPVVSKVRTAGQNASAASFVNQIARAVEAYEADFKQYPGPLTNVEVYNDTDPLNTKLSMATGTGFAENLQTKKITMAENLVLGLLGGLNYNPGPPAKLEYDPRLIGGGAFALNPSGASNKRYKPYLEAAALSWRLTEVPPDVPPAGLKTGQYHDAGGSADDSIIPEFVDPYPDPLPILYLRAKHGATATGATADAKDNSVITFHDTDANNRKGQYDLHQIMAYTNSSIGSGRTKITPVGWGAPPPVHGLSATAAGTIDVASSIQNYDPPVSGVTYKYPFDAFAYFRNQSLSSPKENDSTYTSKTNRNDVPHQKDGFILISAGADRIYGTRDDITNFGNVGQ